MDPRADDRIDEGTEQPVLGFTPEGPRAPDGGIQDHGALRHRRETHPTVPLPRQKQT